jgi:drug/metabolite transporter (DMT)-like permease
VSGAPLALLASLLWGTADFMAGRASRAHPAALVACVGQAVGLVALALVVAFTGVDSGALIPGALSGLVGAVAILAFYRALALGTMSIVAPIVATSAIVPVIAGVVDGERPGTLQWIGVAVALTGVVLASTEASDSEHAVDSRAALRLALLAALLIGFALVFLGAAAEHDALTGVLAARVVAVPILVGVVLYARARAPIRALPQMALIGLLDTGANTAFAIATTGGLLSLVAVLGGLFPVVTVALAYLLLHERLQPTQRAGVLLALAGIPLISA